MNAEEGTIKTGTKVLDLILPFSAFIARLVLSHPGRPSLANFTNSASKSFGVTGFWKCRSKSESAIRVSDW
jgi:hypothetical protein